MVEKRFNQLGIPDIERFENYLPTAFSSELTLLQKVNKIIQDLIRNFDLTNEMVDYLNNFIETFDENLYETVDDILNEWLKNDKLAKFIRDLINEEVIEARTDYLGKKYVNLKERLDSEKADVVEVTKQLAHKANKDEVTNIMTPKGNKLYNSLPTTGNTIGDYYYSPDGDGVNGPGNYVWNGTAWYFGGTGDEGYNKLSENLDKALPNGYAKIGTFEVKWEQQGINSDGTIANVTNAASVGKINILNIPTSFKLVSKDNGYKFNVCEFSKNGDEYIFKKFTEINGVAQAEFNAGFYKIGFFDITESPLDYYNMLESERVKLVESHYELYFNKLPFITQLITQPEFEKPFVIFSFDWYSDSWQKYQIMKPLGLNATFCLDTQTSDYNISDGLTRAQFDEMLENGWDWALYGTIGDRGNTKDSWKAAISGGLKQKENMGIFNPIMYNTPDNNSAQYITEACKELGFLMQRCFINGDNYITSRTQYRTGANYLTNASIDNCKTYVEKAIENKCGVCFYAHNMSDSSDLSVSNFENFINYIAQKVKNGDIEVLSARDYASKYLTDQLVLNDYKASIKQGAFLHKLIN